MTELDATLDVLHAERRALEDVLDAHTRLLIAEARRQGFETGYRAGIDHPAALATVKDATTKQ